MNIEKLPINVPKYLKKAIYFYDVVYTNKNIFRNFIINANNLFKNKTRMKILLLLEKESLNITELSKKVGLSYKVALQHINILRVYRLVKESRKLFSQGREVILSTKGIDFQKNIHIAITNKKESLIQDCYKKLKSIWRQITLEQVSIIFNSVQPWVVDVGQDYATVTPKELKERQESTQFGGVGKNTQTEKGRASVKAQETLKVMGLRKLLSVKRQWLM